MQRERATRFFKNASKKGGVPRSGVSPDPGCPQIRLHNLEHTNAALAWGNRRTGQSNARTVVARTLYKIDTLKTDLTYLPDRPLIWPEIRGGCPSQRSLVGDLMRLAADSR